MEVVKKLCNQVVVLNKGKILEVDSVKNTFLYHRSSLGPVMGREKELVFTHPQDQCAMKLFVSLDQVDILQLFKQEKITIDKLLSTTTDQFRDENITTLAILLDKTFIERISELSGRYPFSYQVMEES